MERNLMIAGFGGQGVMTMGKLLAEATCRSTELKVSFFPSYGAAMRGGTANCYVVISDEEIGAPVTNSVDDLIVMNEPSLAKYLPNLKPGGSLFVNSSIAKGEIDRADINIIKAPVTELAIEMGEPRNLNIIMLGVYIGATGAVAEQVILDGIAHKFEGKQRVIEASNEAFSFGLKIGKQFKRN